MFLFGSELKLYVDLLTLHVSLGPVLIKSISHNLMKHNHNAKCLNNFRPISKLPFSSKILEKVTTFSRINTVN